MSRLLLHTFAIAMQYTLFKVLFLDFANAKSFYGVWYLGHPLHREFLWRSSHGNPSVGGVKPKRVAKYSDFGPIEGYIAETAQDTR